MSSNGKTMVFKLKFYRKIENDSIIVFKWKNIKLNINIKLWEMCFLFITNKQEFIRRIFN